MTARLPDWEPRFVAYLASAAKRPHIFGEHDCLLHVAAAVEALTGEDHGAAHRGKYATKKQAAAYLKSLGFKSPAALIASILPEKPVARAGWGDIVLDDERIPGVVIGGDALMVGAKEGEGEGFVRVPRARWRKAWAV